MFYEGPPGDRLAQGILNPAIQDDEFFHLLQAHQNCLQQGRNLLQAIYEPVWALMKDVAYDIVKLSIDDLASVRQESLNAIVQMIDFCTHDQWSPGLSASLRTCTHCIVWTCFEGSVVG